jgi:hypothetical protein
MWGKGTGAIPREERTDENNCGDLPEALSVLLRTQEKLVVTSRLLA